MSLRTSIFVVIFVVFATNIYAEEQPASTIPPKQDICTKCECTGDKTKIIDCSDKGLESIPNDTVWPTNVSIEARLDHNNFVHIKSFGSIPGLTRLSLSHCRVTAIDDSVFVDLTNLTFIDLSNNQLTTDALGPNVFKGHYAADGYLPMKSMRVLHLGYNALHSLDQDLFEHLTYLEELSLKFNPFKVLDHSTIVAISSLDRLKVNSLNHRNVTM
jgi:Leucine-rich repeat (LRR) protein